MQYPTLQPEKEITDIPALVCGNRLEPATRSAEFNRSLRAEVRDPAWLLARQWQLKEFRAEDRGSPVKATVVLEHAPLQQLQVGDSAVTTVGKGPLPHPLDALVQAQPPVVDWGVRLQVAAQWARLLRRSKLGTKRANELLAGLPERDYALLVPAEPDGDGFSLEFALAQSTGEAYTAVAAISTTAFDGYKLLEAIAEAAASLSASALRDFARSIGATSAEEPMVVAAATQLLAWYKRLYFQADPLGQQPSGWSVQELAYQFRAAAPSSSGTPIVVEAREHLGEKLDWYTVDEAETGVPGFANPTDLVVKEHTVAVPTEIQFAGAPNPRWWEFEDRQVDFGQITGDSSDLGRMLLQEFMFLYHNDWFSFPYTIPTGSICSVRELTITDVFGLRYAVQPAGDNRLTEADGQTEIDHDWGRWSLYALSQRNNRLGSAPRVLLPPTSIGTQQGPVVEQVFFAREEATNLVWGVEQIIPDGMGRGMDGTSAGNRVGEYLRARARPVTALTTAAKLEYKLSTPTTENWIPFVPRFVPGPTAAPGTGFLALEQGEMLRQVDGLILPSDAQTIKPRTALLQYPLTDYLIHERQVPPVGVRVEGNYRRARWFNGRTVTWYGRRRGNGRAGGSSGLAYDQLLPREARSTTASFALTGAQYVAAALASGDAQLRAVADGTALLARVQARELDAAGNVKAGQDYPELDLSRAQLVSLLENGDTFRIANTTDAVRLVTIGTHTYVQRTSLATPPTAGDKLGTFPPPVVVQLPSDIS